MKKIIRLITRLWYRIHIHLYTEYTVADFYRTTFGVNIGKNCRIMDRRIGLFGGEPYLIEVGNNVTFAEDVKLITHDGGVGVLRKEHPGINVFGVIKINNNCFIGVNSTIMPNVEIGENSIIGAGSIVNKDVPSNTVVAGVPAKHICTLAEYEKKVLTKSIIISTNSYLTKKYEVLRFLNMHNKKDMSN